MYAKAFLYNLRFVSPPRNHGRRDAGRRSSLGGVCRARCGERAVGIGRTPAMSPAPPRRAHPRRAPRAHQQQASFTPLCPFASSAILPSISHRSPIEHSSRSQIPEQLLPHEGDGAAHRLHRQRARSRMGRFERDGQMGRSERRCRQHPRNRRHITRATLW